MGLQLEYYGLLVDIAGRSREVVRYDLPDSRALTIRQILEQVCERHSQFKAHLRHTAFALNEKLVADSTEISEDCVIGLLPPVSGG